MTTEVTLVGAKRSAVMGVRMRPATWKSVVLFFDSSMKMIGGEQTLEDWVNENTEYEIRHVSFDAKAGQWMLIGQRPVA